jgi:hypothetical protein
LHARKTDTRLRDLQQRLQTDAKVIKVVARTFRSGLVALLCAHVGVACENPADRRTAEPVAGAPANDESLASEPDDTTTCLLDREPLGSGAFEGDVILSTSGDVAAIADFAEIRGSLRVLSTYSGVLDLPNLRSLGGDLHVEGTPSPAAVVSQLTSLRLPNLERIDGEVWIYLAWNLGEVDLRSLESVAGQLFIMRNVSLRVARLDALGEVGGGMTFQAQTSLPSCVTDPVSLLAGLTLANGAADTRCHCESPCGYLQAKCD